MCLMLSNDNESKVLIDVDQFIQSIYKTELNETLFKNILNDLVPKFKGKHPANTALPSEPISLNLVPT